MRGRGEGERVGRARDWRYGVSRYSVEAWRRPKPVWDPRGKSCCQSLFRSLVLDLTSFPPPARSDQDCRPAGERGLPPPLARPPPSPTPTALNLTLLIQPHLVDPLHFLSPSTTPLFATSTTRTPSLATRRCIAKEQQQHPLPNDSTSAGAESEQALMATAPPPESVEEAAARAAAAARSVFGDLTSGGGASAFGAFGAPPSAPIHAGGSAFGGVSAATSSAFGTSAFGGGGGGSAFGGGGGTSAFAPAAATSAFSAVPTPLFRPVSAVPEELDDGGEEEEEDEEEEGPDDFDLDHDEGEDEAAGEVEQAKRGAGQISTLEVLGEDSDARKKRFEATLPNNRYMEVRPSTSSFLLLQNRPHKLLHTAQTPPRS